MITVELKSIGQFIASLRKEHNLTQDQLGEQLFVTNKTISRWETGIYLPPADALLKMSEIFGVSVNELLCGKRLTETEYKNAAEGNLIQAMEESSFSLQEKIAYFRAKWLREHIAAMVLWAVCILAGVIYGLISRWPAAVAGSLVFTIAAHAWRNNAMAAYVERNAFDGSGRQ